jgi:glutamate--cysteine ligase
MAVVNASAVDDVDLAEPITLDAAHARAGLAALADSTVGAVGLEVEAHLVCLSSPADRAGWDRVALIPDLVQSAVTRCSVSIEPGGQVELSGPPEPGVVTAAARLRHDWVGARLALGEHGLGVAFAGADPLRQSRRVNPRPRYRAMEQHFAATGKAYAGAVMMNSTAALQVNLQAGPRRGWADRVAMAHRLGPTLVAISACSPWLHGLATSWKSARQQAWARLDARACGPVSGADSAKSGGSADPAAAWARFAMDAPVVLVSAADDRAEAVRGFVSFGQWASGSVRLGGRVPTAADLDTHLTTLFPPVRLRGYLELRYLDVSPPRWWPAIAAVASTLMDDQAAADLAAEATEPTELLWTEAARDGLDHQLLARSARRCLAIAAGRVHAALRPAVEDLAELVESGRSPGDLLADRIALIGPHDALKELAHA